MVQKELLDWIKMQARQGYTAKQMKAFLLGHGFSNADIDEALELFYRQPITVAFFQEKTLITLLGPAMLFGFLVSLFVLEIMIGYGWRGFGAVLLLGGFFVLYHYVSANELPYLRHGLYILLFPIFYLLGLPLFIVLLLSLLLSVFFYFGQETKMDFTSYALTGLVALVTATALLLVAIFIVSYPLALYASFGSPYVMLLYLSIAVLAAIICFRILYAELIHRVDKDFDIKRYYCHTLFPFSLTNFLYKDFDEHLNIKVGIRYSLVSYVIVMCIICAMLVGTLSFAASKTYEDINLQKQEFFDEISGLLNENLAQVILYNNGLSLLDYKIDAINTAEDGYYYNDKIYDTSQIYFDCSLKDFLCKHLPAAQKKIETVYTELGTHHFVWAEKSGQQVVVLLPDMVFEEYADVPFFALKALGAEDLPIGKDIETLYKNILFEVADYDFSIIYTPIELVVQGITFNFIADRIDIPSVKLSEFLQLFETVLSTANTEAKFIETISDIRPHVGKLYDSSNELFIQYNQEMNLAKNSVAQKVENQVLSTVLNLRKSVVRDMIADLILSMKPLQKIEKDLQQAVGASIDQQIAFVSTLLHGDDSLLKSQALRFAIAQGIMEKKLQALSQNQED